MREELERARQDTTGYKVYPLALYYFVTGNYSLIVVLVGLGLITFGATALSGYPAAIFGIPQLQWMSHDVFAGMFGVWGATLVVIGVAAYAIMWANKLYARISSDTEPPEETETEPDLETNSL